MIALSDRCQAEILAMFFQLKFPSLFPKHPQTSDLEYSSSDSVSTGFASPTPAPSPTPSPVPVHVPEMLQGLVAAREGIFVYATVLLTCILYAQHNFSLADSYSELGFFSLA